MKELPIVMYADEVRATLAGRKTQLRRVVKDRVSDSSMIMGEHKKHEPQVLCGHIWWSPRDLTLGSLIRSPYGQPGDRLWVRETWAKAVKPRQLGGMDGWVRYRADDCRIENNMVTDPSGWLSSTRMPRWASRITLEVVSVRVERVQDISEADAKAEGILELGNCLPPDYDMNAKQYASPNAVGFKTAVAAYVDLWDSINAKRGFGWQANPWVWVVEFKRI